MATLGRDVAHSGMRSTSEQTKHLAGVAFSLDPHSGVIATKSSPTPTDQRSLVSAVSVDR